VRQAGFGEADVVVLEAGEEAARHGDEPLEARGGDQVRDLMTSARLACWKARRLSFDRRDGDLGEELVVGAGVAADAEIDPLRRDVVAAPGPTDIPVVESASPFFTARMTLGSDGGPSSPHA
jgi:hypothetical protein